MKKLRLIITVSVFCSIALANAQNIDSENKQGGVQDAPTPIRDPVDRPYEKDLLFQNAPVPLQPLDEEYIHYSALIWRVIDLREKINLPLYFPTEVKGNWKSFAQIIWETVDSTENNTMPVRVYSTEYFDIPLSNSEFKEKFSLEPITIQLWLKDEFGNQMFDEYTGDPISTGDTTIPQYASPREILQYDIKELYYVDNQRSMLDVRIMGICPILQKGASDMFEDIEEEPPMEGEFAEGEGEGEGLEAYEEDMGEIITTKLTPLGWLYYPEFRPVMAKNEVFNLHNNANRRSYDDIFLQRHFSSFIRAEENVYDNREINWYIVNGLDQILEAEKIKHKIFAFEHDMWEY
ncbi:MAG: gliding motility protein GldN [Bacteroidales bacterium]|nr:gliding motility protein GldN [Bacteroidales bacterium]MDD4210090.1 gliding motility protein GldN [Bacteroidales bacterium]